MLAPEWGLVSIDWNVYGKIKSIGKDLNGDQAIDKTIAYQYDASGNRVGKTYDGTSTYYVRDAQGNTLAVYDKQDSNPLYWREQQLYGSSRLGIWKPNVNLATGNAQQVWNDVGNKFFELTNHLGNVLAVITDKRVPLTGGGYEAEVVSANDYYAGGMLMPGRSYTAGTSYRYGFNGKENDNEVKGEGNQQDYGMRIYDPRIGRFLSVDPITSQYPELTPYQFASNRPIDGIDLDGLEYMKAIPKFDYTGGFTDVFAAVDNGVINLMNVVPEVWNSGVATYQSLKRGTYLSDLGGDLKQTGVNIKNAAIADWNYTTKTPIVQQLKDRGNQLVQPQTLEQAVTMYIGSKIPNNIGTRDNLLRVSTVKVVKTELSRLQNTFDNLVESDLISKYKALDPKLKYGYTGSFKTGVVGNTSKPTFGNPINLEKFDIDFWIESDVLYKKFGPNLRADPQFRKVLAETPGFEGLKPNKEGFSIKFKPNN